MTTCCNHMCNEGRSCPLRRQCDAALSNTVRRYPRTLADAFPDVRAHAIEPHVKPPLATRIALFLRRRFA